MGHYDRVSLGLRGLYLVSRRNFSGNATNNPQRARTQSCLTIWIATGGLAPGTKGDLRGSPYGVREDG